MGIYPDFMFISQNTFVDQAVYTAWCGLYISIDKDLSFIVAAALSPRGSSWRLYSEMERLLDEKYFVVQSAISVRRRKLTRSKQVDLSFVKCRRRKRFRRTGCLIFCVWIELFWEPCFIIAAMYSLYQTWQFWVKFRYTCDFRFLRNRNIFLSLVGGLEDKKYTSIFVCPEIALFC